MRPLGLEKVRAQAEHLFMSFYTTKPGGLGMGLSICSSIVEAHGARLWVTSNPPPVAIFYFTLAAHRIVIASCLVRLRGCRLRVNSGRCAESLVRPLFPL